MGPSPPLSLPQILELPSKLFYKDQLTCRAVFPSSGPKDILPMKFVGVDGHEQQDEDSPSFYNDLEALKIADEVEIELGYLIRKQTSPE